MWQSSRMNSCEFPLDPCRADHRVIIWEAYDDYGADKHVLYSWPKYY